MEIQQVRYFVALCETLNFTRAAERCNVSQPSLTRAIKLLEDELGGPLFLRERRNTRLTELGRMMQPYLERVMGGIEGAKTEARSVRQDQRTSLKLGLMCTIGPTRLLPMIASFHARNPNIALALSDAKGQVLAERLLGGELEVAILALPGELDERLHALPLFSEQFMITFAPGHRFERQNAVRATDLDGEAYIIRANCEFGEHISRSLDELGVSVNVCYRSERDDWVAAMVLAGLGIGSSPEGAILAPGLLARPLIEPEFVRTVQVVTVRGRPHTPAVGALVRSAMAWRATGCGAMDVDPPLAAIAS
jgi:LysR family hydrogen peroxide-inducible transcriptional activator